MAANSGHGAGRANKRAKDQAMASAMKDTPSRRGTERLNFRCPMGCGALIAREIVGCKNSQRSGLDSHLHKCKGKQRFALQQG